MSTTALMPTSTSRQGIEIAPRRMSWAFDSAPACPVIDGDPDLAAFLLSISYFVVAFEDFGIPVVREALPKVKGHAVLAREAQTFITQEALHSQGHALFNEVMNERHGIDTTRIDFESRRFLADMSPGSAQDRLAAVAALEHVTYSLAEWFEHASTIHARLFPELQRLLLWHAMEETEHTAVVHDVYTHLYGTGARAYRTRVAALARASRVGARALFGMWRALRPQMAARTGRRPSSWRSARAFAAEALPRAGAYASFLRPSFNPWHRPMEKELLPALRQQMQPRHSAPPPDWLPVEVASVLQVAADVRRYELVAADGGDLPAWDAGAHVDLEVETGVVRQYSLCGDPADRGRYVIAVKRDALGSGGSLRLHQQLARGRRLRVGRPRNSFRLPDDVDRCDEALLIAGGIGITPLLAMAHELHRGRTPFRLHACARDRAHLPFAEQHPAWPFATSVHIHLDDAAAGKRADAAALVPTWDDRRPRQLFVCGPAPFMDAVLARARAAGWPVAMLHAERFRHEAGPRPGDRAFAVHLQRSGVTLTVEGNQTIVEAMEARGLKPATSCREGICGACVCAVLAGDVEHRDAVLSDTERAAAGRMTLCVSRARSGALTIDL